VRLKARDKRRRREEEGEKGHGEEREKARKFGAARPRGCRPSGRSSLSDIDRYSISRRKYACHDARRRIITRRLVASSGRRSNLGRAI